MTPIIAIVMYVIRLVICFLLIPLSLFLSSSNLTESLTKVFVAESSEVTANANIVNAVKA